MKCKVLNESVFSECPIAELNKMLQNKKFVTVEKDEKLFEEDKEAKGIFCIYEGEVKIIKKNSLGQVTDLHIAKPGQILAVHDVINNDTFSTSAIAADYTRACFIPKNDFITFLSLNADFALKLMQHLCGEIKIVETKIENELKSI